METVGTAEDDVRTHWSWWMARWTSFSLLETDPMIVANGTVDVVYRGDKESRQVFSLVASTSAIRDSAQRSL